MSHWSVFAFTGPFRAFGLALALALAPLGPAQAQRGQAWHPIKGEDGTPVMNHRVPVELETEIERLPGKAVAGNPKGDVTLVEFYDVNCPYCRRAAKDIADLLRSDRNLRLILVPFPVLSPASVQAARVEFVLARQLAGNRFYDFHQRLYAGRGTIDGARALAVAKDFSADQAQLIEAANRDDVTDMMRAHLRLGNALGLAATPSYVIKGVAIVGHPGAKSLKAIVDSVRRCDRVVCK